MVAPVDYVSFKKKTLLCGVGIVTMLFVGFLTWNFWLVEKPLQDDKDKDKVETPFEISSTNVIFEVGAGTYLSLKPKRAFKHQVYVDIVMDDPDIINTIGSFNVQPDTQRTIFVPLHSKKSAGHCIVSFKSKSPEMEGLFKLRVRVQVVRHIYLGYLSIILGWGYFCVWSLSYYPQIYANYKRRSVVGLSFDYVSLTITGHLCYLVFNSAMYFNSHIQKSYTKLHPKGELPVKANDVVFSLHAVAMCIVIVSQCFIYERGEQKLAMPMATFVSGIWLSIFGALYAGIMEKIGWLQFLYYLSYIKVGTTPIKYTPQVYLNYCRKSTDGWAIATVLMDGFGGILGLLQMLFDAFNYDDWDGTLGNPGKLGLSCIAMIYNAIFILQHYVLYPQSRRRKDTGPDKMALDKDQASSTFKKQLEELKASFTPVKKTKVKRVYDV